MNMKLIDLVLSKVSSHKTFVVYFFIGASASLIDLAGFYIFYSLSSVPSPLATTYSVSIATVYAFLLNSFFNFKMTDRFLLRFLSYASVSGVGLIVSALLLWCFNVVLGFDGNIIKIISLPIVFIVQYFLNKKITFQSFADKKENYL